MSKRFGGFDCLYCNYLDKMEDEDEFLIEGICTFHSEYIVNPEYTVCHVWTPNYRDISDQPVKELVNKLNWTVGNFLPLLRWAPLGL